MKRVENRILILDDQPKQTRALCDALRANGNHVDEATTFDAARQFISANDYQLFVLDREVLTPEGPEDGLELCREIRDQGIPARIVFFTNLMTPSDHREGWEAGADDYIEKSWSSDVAIARCEAHLIRESTNTSVGSAKRYAHPLVEPGRHLVVDGASFIISRAQTFNLLRQGGIAKHRFSYEERELYKKTKMTDLDVAVFFYLYGRRNSWVSEEELLTDVWGYSELRVAQMMEDPDSNSGLVHTTISRIRRKIDSRIEQPDKTSGSGNKKPWAYVQTNAADEQVRVRYRFNTKEVEIADFPVEPLV